MNRLFIQVKYRRQILATTPGNSLFRATVITRKLLTKFIKVLRTAQVHFAVKCRRKET